jgi:hypothetical protein
MKHRFTYCAMAVIVLSMTSCGAAAEGPIRVTPSPSTTQELPTKLLLSDGGKKAIVHSGPSSAPRVGAQITGTLQKDGAGCITARANDGDDWTLVFPEGTKFKGESLVLPDGSTLTEGDSVELDGARVPANESLSMCLNYARLLSVDKAAVISS